MSATTINPLPLPEEQRKSVPRYLTIHKCLPFAVLYFFFNSVGLPLGLFYTTILSPLFFIWLYLKGKRWLTFKFLLCLSPFVIAHARLGVDSPFYYMRSVLLLWTVYITAYAFGLALVRAQHVERLFEQLIVLNFFAALIALALLPTPLGDPLWNANFNDLGNLPGYVRRLQLLTLEPSHYGFEMTPLLIFMSVRLLQKPDRRNLLYVLMILLPLILSQSFGALSMCTAALAVALIPALTRLLRKGGSILILAAIGILLMALLLIPNPISLRVSQVVAGSDSSINSRTLNAFALAYLLATSKSIWWGIGIGQSKLQDVFDLHVGFNVAIIPNAMAATFAELGLVAVLVKFFLEFYLFFRTRVYRDSFRLAMFVVAFICQLTGSYLTDVQEYLTWFFAFVQIFPVMNLMRRLSRRVNG